MSSPEYWIWLQKSLGIGVRVDEILSFFHSPKELYLAGRREWLLSGVINPKTADKLLKYSPSEARSVVEECRQGNWHIVTPEDAYYPERLLQLRDLPLVLYVWGDKEVLKAPVAVSIVGTRNASRYGSEVAESLAFSLAQAGVVVVSGGALGIDSRAHIGAIEAKGKTIAYLGCGLNCDYLRENKTLREAIARNGCVVSEFPPQTQASRYAFPIRNRLIAGTALGTVVIEAGEKSGSLITARLALEQGRDVFAVPGNIISSSFKGANRLIREGAKPVFTAYDILEEYQYLYGEHINISEKAYTLSIKKEYNNTSDNSQKSMKSPNSSHLQKTSEKKAIISTNLQKKQAGTLSLGDSSLRILSVLNETPITADDIALKAKLNIGDVLAGFTELELFGLCELHSGKRYTAVYIEKSDD